MLGKNPNFGVRSQIQRAKFGAFVTYIFGGKIWAPTRISEANFGAKRPPDMEVPPLGFNTRDTLKIVSRSCEFSVR